MKFKKKIANRKFILIIILLILIVINVWFFAVTGEFPPFIRK